MLVWCCEEIFRAKTGEKERKICLAEACNRFYPKLELLTGLYSQEGKAAQAIQQEHEGIFQAIKDSGFSAGAQAMRCHLQQDMFLALGAFRMRKDKSD